MKNQYSTADNIVYGANPFDWSRGGKSKVGAMFDPFNFTGWGEKVTPQYEAQPTQPGYQQVYDPLSMAFAPEVQKRLDALALDTRGLEAFRNEALRRGPSSWAKLSTRKQFAEEADARDRAKQEARSSQAQAEADLAMRGGLSGGARERLTAGGARNLLAMSQDVGRQGGLNRMQIGINDEQNRISQLGMLPGMENSNLQAQLQKENLWENARQSDLQRTQAENERRNQWNQMLYQQQMQAWASNRQAQATENAGKK